MKVYLLHARNFMFTIYKSHLITSIIHTTFISYSICTGLSPLSLSFSVSILHPLFESLISLKILLAVVDAYLSTLPFLPGVSRYFCILEISRREDQNLPVFFPFRKTSRYFHPRKTFEEERKSGRSSNLE